jgi:hypothetical protein
MGDYSLSWWKAMHRKAAQPPKPTPADEKKIRAEYKMLYTAQQPTGPLIDIHAPPAAVNDVILTEEEIKKAIKWMCLGKAPGTTGIHTEHLRMWMEEAETTNLRQRWDKLVEIVQLSFEGKLLASSFGTGILVLIPNGEPDQF